MARIVLLTLGTDGDVAPYVGLGQRLAAAGHRVRIGAAERYADVVTGAGLEFAALPVRDPRYLAGAREGRRAARGGLVAMARAAAAEVRRPIPAMIDAVADADVVLATLSTLLLAPAMAEARGAACVALALAPSAPTREHGPPMLLAGRSLGWLGNVVLPAAMIRVATRAFTGLTREVRADLGLPARPVPGYHPDELTVLHGISPVVYPRPADWHPRLEVTGYWWPADPGEGWRPDPELAAFLDAGPPPVFVGFGSAGADGRGERVARAVGDALRRTGRRAVVQRGWAELDVDAPDVLHVGEVPHAWLFPRVAAVVHHGGAGTTAAGLRAGVPAVPVPFSFDQPFWARRLVELGVAPCALPARRLRGDRLAEAITAAVEGHGAGAASVARRLAAEDGAARIVEVVAERVAGGGAVDRTRTGERTTDRAGCG